MKEITSKKKKTEADLLLMGDLEWVASWYYEDDQIEIAINGNALVIGDYGRLVLPTRVIDAMLLNAAKKNRMGNEFKSGVFVEQDASLELEPKKSLTEMQTDPNFRIATMERIKASKILRTRPYLKNWKSTFVINYDNTVVNRTAIEQAIEVGSRLIGLCERRPKWGRFSFEIK